MYYKSSLSYDIAVRNGERKLINLETLNIPCVAANNEELAGFACDHSLRKIHSIMRYEIFIISIIISKF